MDSLREISEQLRENNETALQRSEELISVMKDISVSLDSGFNRLEKTFSKVKVTTSPFKLRIPGLASLKNALTDNPIVNALSSLKNGILAAITAPFAIVQTALIKVKDTFVSVFKGFGNIIMAPFRLISGLFRRKDDETLKNIYDKLVDIDNNIDSYFSYLKNKDLDKLEKESEAKKEPVVKEDVEKKSLKDKLKGTFDFLKALPGILGTFLTGTLGAITIAVAASLTGLDDALRLIRLPKIKLPKFEFMEKLKGFFTVAEEGGTKTQKFFSAIGKLFKPLLKPFAAALKLFRANPITGIILSVIDGVVGFFKGFMGTEGTFTTKLLGGLEGAILGIITGITDAIDLLIFKIPAWLLEKLGLEKAAEFLRGLSLTKLVENVYFGVKSLFENGGEGFKRLAQKAKDFIALQIERIKNSIFEQFDKVTMFFANIPDRIISAFGRAFSFEIPSLSIPKPDWLGGGEFVLVKGFKVGGGDVAEAAEQRIAAREQTVADRKRYNQMREDKIAARLDRPVFPEDIAEENRRLALEARKRKMEEKKARQMKYIDLAREQTGRIPRQTVTEDLQAARQRNNRAASLESGAVTQAQLKRDMTVNNAPNVTTNIDGRTTQNNTTVLNQGSLPSTVDYADRPVF